ncbi:glycoprotease family protein [Thermosipho africanus Ob7]|uniref:tRNA (adenosine(37)-N6)-threonylcarbamoyltransferase complex dimerization subunit type 1 TsaB n=1 Tax=Thermosipho africanus TaxID=2421 RepID=UPI000E0B68F9|nr:tRNA (adenosine(37)-N6)-threonylcarbamoyltransferase complex dimerization subunit type 1 TsaB [Thermosipho africanus]RDI91400.1 glycoprotease family protein [Thermosipho africanus Ob7]
MKILALDTSTSKIVVYYRDSEKIITQTYMGKDKHGRNLGVVMNNLKNFNINFEDIDVVGIGIGPGSLTGLRVGISFALGLSIDKKIVVVPSTKLIAANLMNSGKNIVVTRKARQGYIYGAIYDEYLNTIVEPFVESIENFSKEFEKMENFVVIGDGAEYFGGNLPEIYNYPEPSRLGYLVEKEIEVENFVEKVEPLYIQKSIAEINFEKKKQRKDG